VNDSYLMGAKSGWGSMTSDGIKVTVDKWSSFLPFGFFATTAHAAQNR